MNDFSYDAFISYSHSDLPLAEKLSKRIRRYRPPRQLQVPRRKLVVFRDVERLTAGVDVSDALLERIQASRKLILLCSPSAVESTYVNHEVSAFLEMREAQSLVLVLAAGEPGSVYPAVVRETMGEPLFIDLRRKPTLWGQLGAFRRESLRLLAAILDVDFTELRREDENRRRRRRNLNVFMILLVLMVAAVAYLIQSVPPQHWHDVKLPTTHWDSPVMPVRKFAVNRDDPEKLLFELHDAYHASQAPERPVSVRPGKSSLDPTRLRQQVKAHLDNLRDLDTAGQPIARLRFEATDGEGPPAHGEMRIYAYLDESGQPWFFRSLLYTSTAEHDRQKRLVLPPTPASAVTDPLSWDPWPTAILINADLMPMGHSIDATVDNFLDGSSTPVTYDIIDEMESFTEFDDGMLFERAIASNDPDIKITLGDERLPLADIEKEVTWADVENMTDWATYTPPRRHWYENIHPQRVNPNEAEGDIAAALTAQVGGRETIGRFLADLGIDWQAWEHRHDVSIVARQAGDLVVEVISVISSTSDMIAHRLSSRSVNHYLRNPSNPLMREIRFPALPPDTRVIDIWPIDNAGLNLILRIQPGGLIHTTDGGETWQEFNLDQGAIETARNIDIVVTGQDRAAVYVLAYDDDETTATGGSRLFHLQRKGWLERCKAGLIKLLGGQL